MLLRTSTLVLTVGLALGACHRNNDQNVDAGVTDMPEVPSLDAACAIGGAKAVLKRLNLVVIYDRSGSMGDGTNGDPMQKWIPVGKGLKAFFEDPESVGVTASLQYFPYKANPLEQCNSSAYFFPDVPLTALPSTTFGTNIDGTTPGGLTPTLPAIQGAIASAQQIASGDPNAKIAIILVTDGEPDACGSSVQNVSLEVAKVKVSIPTYVVGIGLAQDALASISDAGGTGNPIIVSVGDQTQTRADILSALTAIRGQQVPCEFPLPSPPLGMALDIDKVNVLYTPGSGTQTALMYSKTCAGDDGWRYDDAAAPTKVLLCNNTCRAIQKDKAAVVDILFGCQTRGDVL